MSISGSAATATLDSHLDRFPRNRGEREGRFSGPLMTPNFPPRRPGAFQDVGDSSEAPGTRLLIAKLEQFGRLAAEDLAMIRTFVPRTVVTASDTDVVRVGDHLTHCSLLLDGFLCRYKTLEDGRRQITSFHVPGDIPDLTSMLVERVDYAVSSLTPVKLAVVPRSTLLGWMERSPRLAHLFWKVALLDAAIHREWVVSLGRRSAYERIAHLLCELVTRLNAGGFVKGRTCDLPITQSELADATGLSAVHVNRTLQQLRSEKLIELRGGTLVVSDWEGLTEAAEFDPDYLQLSAATG